MPSLRKVPGSPYFIAVFRDENGKQFNRSTKQKDRVRALAVALEFERMARGWIAENPTVSAVYRLATDLAERIGKPIEAPSIRDEFNSYLASLGAKAPSTRDRYGQILKQFLQQLGAKAFAKIFTLTTADIEGFRDMRLAEGIAPQSVAYEMKLITSVLSRAMKAGRVQKNPGVDADRPEGKSMIRDVFEAEHVCALLIACKLHKRGNDWRGAILAAFYTGARLGDVANLRWSNVDFQKRALRFTPQKTKRLGGEIQIPLHPELESELLRISAPDNKPDAPLFPRLAGRETGGAHGLSREFAGLISDAGIERHVIRAGGGKGRAVHNLGAHSFRHAFATHLHRGGVPEDVRMRLTGHETKDIARRYTHTELEQLRIAVETLPSVSSR